MFDTKNKPQQTKPISRAVQPADTRLVQERRMQTITTLSPSERLNALIYALNKVKQAGNTGNNFDAEAALAVLDVGKLQLSGTPDQIHAQLLLIEAAKTVLSKAFAFDHEPQPVSATVDQERLPPEPPAADPMKI